MSTGLQAIIFGLACLVFGLGAILQIVGSTPPRGPLVWVLVCVCIGLLLVTFVPFVVELRAS